MKKKKAKLFEIAFGCFQLPGKLLFVKKVGSRTDHLKAYKTCNLNKKKVPSKKLAAAISFQSLLQGGWKFVTKQKGTWKHPQGCGRKPKRKNLTGQPAYTELSQRDPPCLETLNCQFTTHWDDNSLEDFTESL